MKSACEKFRKWLSNEIEFEYEPDAGKILKVFDEMIQEAEGLNIGDKVIVRGESHAILGEVMNRGGGDGVSEWAVWFSYSFLDEDQRLRIIAEKDLIKVF